MRPLPTVLSGCLLLMPLVWACSGGEPAAEYEAVAAASPPAAVASERPADPMPDRPRIVFLGDSLTAGLGLPIEQSYPALIQERLDRDGYRYQVVNAGVSGDTSAGGLRRFEWSTEGNVAVLVVALGGNDGLRGLPPADLRRNLDEIIGRATARGMAVVLAGMEAPPNIGPAYTSAFRQVYQDLAREHGVTLIPFLLEGVAGETAFNQPDGIHPNAAGARRVAETVWEALVPVLAEADDPE